MDNGKTDIDELTGIMEALRALNPNDDLLSQGTVKLEELNKAAVISALQDAIASEDVGAMVDLMGQLRELDPNNKLITTAQNKLDELKETAEHQQALSDAEQALRDFLNSGKTDIDELNGIMDALRALDPNNDLLNQGNTRIEELNRPIAEARSEAKEALSKYGFTDAQIDKLLFENGKLKEDYKDAIDNAVKVQEAFRTIRGMKGTEHWTDEYIYSLVADGRGIYKKDCLKYVENILKNAEEQAKIASALAAVRNLEAAKDWGDDYIYSLILNDDGTLKDNYMDAVYNAITQGQINNIVGTVRYWLDQYQNGNNSAAGDLSYWYNQLTRDQKNSYFTEDERALIESIIAQGSQSSGEGYSGASSWTQQEGELEQGEQVAAGEQFAPISGTKFRASDVLRPGETYSYKYNFDFEKYDADLYKADKFFASEEGQFAKMFTDLTEQINTDAVETKTEQLSSFKQFWNDNIIVGTIVVAALAVAAIATIVFLAVPALTFSAFVVLGGLVAGAVLGGIYVGIASQNPSLPLLPTFKATQEEIVTKRTEAHSYAEFQDGEYTVEITGKATKNKAGVISYTYTKAIKRSDGSMVAEITVNSSSETGLPISYTVASYDENGVLDSVVECEDSTTPVFTKTTYDKKGNRAYKETIDVTEAEQIYKSLGVGNLSTSMSSFATNSDTLYPYFSFLDPKQNGETTQLYDNSLVGIEILQEAVLRGDTKSSEEVLTLLEQVASQHLRLSDRDDENYVKTGEALWAGIFAEYCRNSGIDFGSEEANARANAAIDTILRDVDDYLGTVDIDKNGTLGFEGMKFNEDQPHWVSTEHMLDAAMYYALKGDTASLNKVLQYIKTNLVNPDGSLKQGLKNDNQALDTYTWGYMMLSSIKDMDLEGVDIDSMFGENFVDGLLDKMMSYQKADGTFGFSNIQDGVVSGEFTMQAYAALAAAGREDDANAVLQSAIKSGLVVMENGNVYVKYTTDADSGRTRDNENYPVYSDRSLASTAWLKFGLEELQSNLNGGSSNIFTIANNGNIGATNIKNIETIDSIVTTLNGITINTSIDAKRATEDALLEVEAVGQTIYDYYEAGNITEAQRDQLYGFVQQKAMDIDLYAGSSVRQPVNANAVRTQEAIREVGYRQYTVTDGKFELEKTGSTSDKSTYLGKVNAFATDKDFQESVAQKMFNAIVDELNKLLGVNFLNGDLIGKLVNKIIGNEAYQKTDDISTWSARAVKNYFSTAKNFDDIFAGLPDMNKDQQTELLTKLISFANTNTIANLINNIKDSKDLDDAQKQELLNLAYEKQISLAGSLTDADKIIRYINNTDSSILTDSQKSDLLRQAYDREISITENINQLKDNIIPNIEKSTLDDQTKASLIEQAFLKEIEASTTFDNIHGRIRDIQNSNLSDETKATLITAAQNRLKEIYITRMNKETNRANIRSLSKEMFDASRNRQNNDLGVEILTQDMLNDLFDAIETRVFALDISNGSYVRQGVGYNGVITKTAMLEMKEAGDYPKVNRETGVLESADPYITRINNYIPENNLEATVQQNLRTEVRKQFKTLLGISSEQVLSDETIDQMIADVNVVASDTQKTWASKALNRLFYDDDSVNALVANIKDLKLPNEADVIDIINDKYYDTLNERLDNATTLDEVNAVAGIIASSSILTDAQKEKLNESVDWYKTDLVDLLAGLDNVAKVENASYLDKSNGYWVGNSIVYPKIFRYLVTMKDGSSMYVYRYTNGEDRFSISNKKKTFEDLSNIINAWQGLVAEGYQVESNLDQNKNQYFTITKDGVSVDIYLFNASGDYIFDLGKTEALFDLFANFKTDLEGLNDGYSVDVETDENNYVYFEVTRNGVTAQIYPYDENSELIDIFGQYTSKQIADV